MKIIISASTSWNLYNSRMGLALALKREGHEVVMLSPRDEFTAFLMQAGFRWVHFPLQPRGKNPFREAAALLFLVYFYLYEKPDLVNHFTPKGVIYGSIAAKIAGLRSIFNTITGLGVVFSKQSDTPLKRLVIALYRLALVNTIVLFQNKDDQMLFQKEKIGNPESSFLIPGSGIDMERFVYSPESEGIPVVMLPSRFVEEKGIRYFIEASRILRSQGINARFVLVGRPEDDQPSSIPLAEISQWMNEGVIEWWGWHNDMEQIYPLAHIVCLPTYYMEGIPKSLMEAASCGRALVATDVPGCREIVINGENGLLVLPRDAQSLAGAIAMLVNDPFLRKKMGMKGREIVVGRFSLASVVSSYLRLYSTSGK